MSMQWIYLSQCLYQDMCVWHSLSHENVVPFLGLCHNFVPSPAIVSPLYSNSNVVEFLHSNLNADHVQVASYEHGFNWMHLSFIRLLVLHVVCNIYIPGMLSMATWKESSLFYILPGAIIWWSCVIFLEQYSHRWWLESQNIWYWSFKIICSLRFHQMHGTQNYGEKCGLWRK